MLNTVRQAGQISDLICAKIYTDMPWSTSNRFVQNAAQSFFLASAWEKPEYY